MAVRASIKGAQATTEESSDEGEDGDHSKTHDEGWAQVLSRKQRREASRARSDGSAPSDGPSRARSGDSSCSDRGKGRLGIMEELQGAINAARQGNGSKLGHTNASEGTRQGQNQKQSQETRYATSLGLDPVRLHKQQREVGQLQRKNAAQTINRGKTPILRFATGSQAQS